MYKNTNCFHLAIPCGDLEKAKKFYSETLGCRLDNADQEWADVDFWGNELTLHASEQKLENERHDVDMGAVCVPHFGVHLPWDIYLKVKQRIEEKIGFYDNPYIRFEGKDTQQETFFVEDPNFNMLEIKSIQGTNSE